MPYQYNYGSNDSAEYQAGANADSVNGKRGATRATATREPSAPAGNAYLAFKQSNANWYNPQPALASSPKVPTAAPTVNGSGANYATRMDPAVLARILGKNPNGDVLTYESRMPDNNNGGEPTGGNGIPTQPPPAPTPTGYGAPPRNLVPNLSEPVVQDTTGGGRRRAVGGNPVDGTPVIPPTPSPVVPPPAPPLPPGTTPPPGFTAPPTTPAPAPVFKPFVPTPPVTNAPPTITPPPQRADPNSWRNVAMPAVADDKTLGNALREGYSDEFAAQSQDLARVLRGEAALTGDSNAGGYLEVAGREQGRLASRQGQEITDKMFEARENERNRAVQQFGIESDSNTQRFRIDADLVSARMADDTRRFDIKTNAEFEAYLANNREATARWGISTQAVMDAYQAELQARGQQYAADRGFDASVLDAAVRRAIADTNAAADRYATDAGRQNVQDQVNLGWGNLEGDLYQTDVDAQIRWADILRQTGLTPAQLAQILTGFTPGTVYVPPGG